jgi:hypothetical protein
MAAIEIHWGELAHVAEISLAFGVGVVVVFTLAVLGMSRVEAAGSDPSARSARLSGLALAGAALLVCAAAVGYGLYLMIPQFH